MLEVQGTPYEAIITHFCWETLSLLGGGTSSSLVREFYANFADWVNDRVYVQGSWHDFGP